MPKIPQMQSCFLVLRNIVFFLAFSIGMNPEQTQNIDPSRKVFYPQKVEIYRRHQPDSPFG